MREYLNAAVRTGVQALIGLIVAVPLIAQLGIADELGTLLEALGVGIVTLVLRYLETKFPVLIPILSLGVTKSGPSYS